MPVVFIKILTLCTVYRNGVSLRCIGNGVTVYRNAHNARCMVRCTCGLRNVSADLSALPVNIWRLRLAHGHEARPVVSGKPHAGAYKQHRSQAALASSATLHLSRCRSTILTAMACIRSLRSTTKLPPLNYARYRPESQLWQIQFSPVVSHNRVHEMSHFTQSMLCRRTAS